MSDVSPGALSMSPKPGLGQTPPSGGTPQGIDSRQRSRTEARRPSGAIYTSDPYSGHPEQDPEDAVHVWEADGPMRGRTHYSWSLLKTDSLLRGIESGPVVPRRDQQNIMLDAQSKSIVAEFPAPHLCRSLAARYFDTFGTVYHLVDEEEFNTLLERSLADPRTTSLCFALRALTVFAIGNSTVSFEDAPLPRSLTLRWLELASPTTTIALETSSEFDVEAIRTWTLINLARQTISSNEMADYVSAGGAVKAGMACGMHRIDAQSQLSQASYDRMMLFYAAVDLDLTASITAGLPPTKHGPDNSLGRRNCCEYRGTASSDDLRAALYGSICVRYRILDCLNRDAALSYWQVQDLTDELTRSMSAVALRRPWDKQSSFLLEYTTATYRRFLFALHRPFADFDGSQIVAQSARIVSELARKQILDNIQYWNEGTDRSPMAALFLGYGVTAHADVLHALCYFWWSARKSEDDMNVVNRALQFVARDDSEFTLERFSRHSQQMHWTHRDSWLIYSIAEMATAHVRIARHCAVDSPGYDAAMDLARLDVKERLVRVASSRDHLR